MDIIERYIYAVTKRLPESQREDVGNELRSLIEDMLVERYGEVTTDISNVEEILIELGEPSKLASKYRNKERYLIGPEYFDLYIFILKIVVFAVFFGVLIAKGVELFVNQPTDVLETIVEYFNAIIFGVLGGFAWVTVIFAVIEHKTTINNVNLINIKWKPKDLMPVPKENSIIKKSEPIVSIIFTIIFIIVINITYNLIGAYILDDNQLIMIPLFSEVFTQMLPLITISLCISIIKECLKLIIGKWTFPLSIFCSLIVIITMIINVVVFANPEIWNMDFMLQMNNIEHISGDTLDIVTKVWNAVTSYFVYFLVVVGTIEVIATLAKGIKNREEIIKM